MIKNIDNWKKYGIHEIVSKNLLENNFKHPTEIQKSILSCFRDHYDFIIASQTVKILIMKIFKKK